MNFVIREMKEEDILSVQYVAKASWNDTYKDIIPAAVQEKFLGHAYSPNMMKHRLQHSHLFVGEVDGKVVGFANFLPIKHQNEAELGAIYLLPAYQGNGMGTALLRKGITTLEGVKKIYINVEAENKTGKAFYTAKGFAVVDAFEEDFDGHTLKTLRMVLHV
ncbi:MULTISPECIES: GNAT family N-acetyltransferase [unclassified Bacillus (in: firmicutes)]|uniref:GNAT family N-acetyltransferase n=1 Tax=unclassified Bacillus (in: firmicutes) TaxID=185979 RepID=UPI0008E2F06D|nr:MULTISPECIES: GNAT family N-acetyltransferase [unclassified Bacillus (in: firmicutes)]SFI03840.1 Acetyltransferase (GNAT) family protein [Bacillus sp. 71mf]SFS80674.1 Acetyltransferase (GNAT) family protein [Bacillus sp. 103mf]